MFIVNCFKKFFIVGSIIFSAYVVAQQPVHIDTDFGFDGDDQLAVLNVYLQNPTIAISTTLYRPDQKAALVRCTLGREVEIPISAGYGVYDREEESFLNRYSTWPLAFGDPAKPYRPWYKFQDYECIYPFQAKAYNENLSLEDILDAIAAVPKNDLSSVREFYQRCEDQSVLVISLAPTQNLDTLIRDPEVARKINRIVMMGGWLGTLDNPERLGYNTVLSLESSRNIFASGIPITLVTSGLCRPFTLNLLSLQRGHKDPLGKILLDSMMNWEVHRARKTQRHATRLSELKLDNPILADVLTAFIALNPACIKATEGVAIDLFPEKVFEHPDDRIHMLHQRAPELFSVRRQEGSNIQVVTELHEPEKIHEKLLENFLQLFEDTEH